MRHLAYGIKYVIKHQLFKKATPLICGIVLHNKCNLRCRHCRITERSTENLDYEQVKGIITSFYNKGGRTLYFEGGEPFLWQDGRYVLEDAVEYAKNTGYLATIIYTNGTFPLESSADTIFISMDGLQKTNDFLRGNVFARIMGNILISDHPSLYINFTINSYNKNELLEFCDYINGIKQIQGIFFYFHTPYYGYDELFIDEVEKKEILNKLIKNKKNYKILNSIAGLKSALRNDWRRPLNICQVYEGGKTYSCCRISGNKALCAHCGYLSYAEIDQVLKLKPSAIRNALKYF